MGGVPQQVLGSLTGGVPQVGAIPILQHDQATLN